MPAQEIGKKIDMSCLYKGKESVFFEYFKQIVGEQDCIYILKKHAYERTGLIALLREARTRTCVDKLKLLELANGDPDLMGFCFLIPGDTALTGEDQSWAVIAKHWHAEQHLGKAIHEPLSA